MTHRPNNNATNAVWLGILIVIAVLFATMMLGCRVDAAGLAPLDAGADADPCGGTCGDIDLCVTDEAGAPVCAQRCASQLRCWSGCCLAVSDTANVCRPTAWCFPGEPLRITGSK